MYARNRSHIIIAVLAITLLTNGCAVRMYPGYNPTKLIGEVDRDSVRDDLKECRKTEDVVCRDEVVQALMAYVDQGFLKFKARLQQESQQRKIWLGWANLGLSTATSVVSGVRSKTNLGTAATLLQGGEPILDEHGLQGQAIYAIVRQMDSERARVRKRVFDGLLLGTNKYPLSDALSDVTRYYYAGSLPTALGQLAATADDNAITDKKLADDSLEKFRKMDQEKVTEAESNVDKQGKNRPGGE